LLMKDKRYIASHFDGKGIGHGAVRKLFGISLWGNLLLQISADPSGLQVFVVRTAHEEDVASAEMRAVVILVRNALNHRHASLIVHGLHRRHVGMQAHLLVRWQCAVEGDVLPRTVTGR